MDNPDRFHGNFNSAVATMFHVAKRDHGLSARHLSALTGIPAATMETWAHGTAMPAWAFWMLAQHIPNDLLTLCAEMADKAVITCESGGDLDALGREAANFTANYVNAKSDGKIDHREAHSLRNCARKLACVAGAA